MGATLGDAPMQLMEAIHLADSSTFRHFHSHCFPCLPFQVHYTLDRTDTADRPRCHPSESVVLVPVCWQWAAHSFRLRAQRMDTDG